MEFPSCEKCNHGTRAADAAAGFFSRMDAFGDDVSHWAVKEALPSFRTVEAIVPGFADELLNGRLSRPALVRSAGGILARAEEIHVGPIGQALVTVFAAKLGMAIYCEHIGVPLPEGGGVYTLCFLNAGFHPGQAEALLSILPVHSTLQQGRRRSATGQFDYRFNTDGKSVVATLSHFHGNMHIFSLAAADPTLFTEVFSLDATFSGLVRTGELLAHMPLRSPAILMLK